ncbi:hypothetical protein NX059_002117 [Plenodomus lindquistii]|nr:hypothetical protein NX059_002117 [Plenodomus lindquistii]
MPNPSKVVWQNPHLKHALSRLRNLHSFRLRLTIDFYTEFCAYDIPINLRDVVPDGSVWPSLRHLSLGRLVATQASLFPLLFSFSDLRSIELDGLFLDRKIDERRIDTRDERKFETYDIYVLLQLIKDALSRNEPLPWKTRAPKWTVLAPNWRDWEHDRSDLYIDSEISPFLYGTRENPVFDYIGKPVEGKYWAVLHSSGLKVPRGNFDSNRLYPLLELRPMMIYPPPLRDLDHFVDEWEDREEIRELFEKHRDELEASHIRWS